MTLSRLPSYRWGPNEFVEHHGHQFTIDGGIRWYCDCGAVFERDRGKAAVDFAIHHCASVEADAREAVPL